MVDVTLGATTAGNLRRGKVSGEVRQAVGLGTGLPVQVHTLLDTPASAPIRVQASRLLRVRSFELKDHLGNVRVLVSDQKDANAAAQVQSYYNYYAFGMEMPNRTYDADKAYRYGFNGKENDKDFGTAGLTQDYGFRLYNLAIAKFLSVDPLEEEYPELSPYHFAHNSPIENIDLDGLEKQTAIDGSVHNGPYDMKLVNASIIKKQQDNQKQIMTKKADTPSNLPTKHVINADNRGHSQKKADYKERKANWDAQELKKQKAEQYKNNPELYMVADGVREGLASAGGQMILSKGLQIGRLMYFGDGAVQQASPFLRILGSDATTMSNAANMVIKPGTYQVLVHGTGDFFISNGSKVTSKTMAKIMLEGGFKKGTPVQLNSCWTGVHSDGAAYQLSVLLKSPVTAPTNELLMLPGGKPYVMYGGRMRSFSGKRGL